MADDESASGEEYRAGYTGLSEQERGPLGCMCGICLSVVDSGSIGVVQQCGEYKGYQDPGCMCYCPCICSVKSVSLAVKQLNCTSDCKTKDNVTLTVATAVQYRISKAQVKTAIFDILDPEAQIQAQVDDVLRSTLPTLDLDEAYSSKDRICGGLLTTVKQQMGLFGYIILNVLVTDLRPETSVLQAMNDINASRRQRMAAIEKGEAEKTLKVKAAEAQAEAMHLSGVGVAKMRRAMADGFKDSMETMEASGLRPPEAMHMMITTQYLDTLKEFAASGRTGAIMVPTGPSSRHIEAQVRDGFVTSSSAMQGYRQALPGPQAPVQQAMPFVQS